MSRVFWCFWCSWIIRISTLVFYSNQCYSFNKIFAIPIDSYMNYVTRILPVNIRLNGSRISGFISTNIQNDIIPLNTSFIGWTTFFYLLDHDTNHVIRDFNIFNVSNSYTTNGYAKHDICNLLMGLKLLNPSASIINRKSIANIITSTNSSINSH